MSKLNDDQGRMGAGGVPDGGGKYSSIACW
jgi:hypothetical protein